MKQPIGVVDVLLRVLTDEALAAPLPAEAWPEIAAEAERRDVAPLLYARLRADGRLTLLPAGVRRTLEQQYAFSALRNRVLLNELSAVLRRFAQHTLDVIVLKGAFLAEAVYRDPALRPMGDLDLLVRADDRARAAALLRELGYSNGIEGVTDSQHPHEPAFQRAGSAPIELHRAVGELRHTAELWQRARPVTIAGAPACALSATDLLLHLALHTARHHAWHAGAGAPLPLRALFDIALALEHYDGEIDWALLARVANEQRSSRHVYAALCVVQKLTAARIPEDALSWLQHDPETDRMVGVIAQAVTASARGEIPVAYGSLARSQGVWARLRVVLQSLFPRLEQLRAMYNLPANSRRAVLYYFVRPFDLLLRRGGTAFALLFRTSSGQHIASRQARRDEITRWIRD